MRKNLRIFIPAILAFSLAGCDEDWNPDELSKLKTGTLVLTEMTVSNGADDANSFIATIATDAGVTLYHWGNQELPDNVDLMPGNYKLVISSRENAAVWGGPIYTATENIQIVESENTAIGSVKCQRTSVGVSVSYSDDLLPLLGEDAKVTISAGSDIEVVFTRAEKRTAHFMLPEGSTTMAVSFTGVIENEAVNHNKLITDITNGQDIIIDYVVDDLVKPKVDPTAPLITSETLNIDGVNVITEDIIAKVDVVAPNGIEKFEVEIISAQLTKEELQNVGLDSEFDLANPGDLVQPLTELGFPTGNAVKSKTQLEFDITNFMQLLAFFQGTHQFKLTITDAKGLITTKTLTFQAL